MACSTVLVVRGPVLAKEPAPPAKPSVTRPASPEAAVARVGGYVISSGELENAAYQLEAEYQRQTGRKVQEVERPMFRRSVLEQLIRQRLLRAEAKRRGVVVADAEADRFLRAQPDFSPGGRFDPARWAAFTSDPARYQGAIADAKELLGSQRLFQRLQNQLVPSNAELVRHLERSDQRAEVRVAILDPRWLEAGVELEPDSIRAHYRSLRSRFERPARARISLAAVALPEDVNPAQPPPADLQRTKARADSLLTLVRAGTSFDSLAASLGGTRDAGWWVGGQEMGLFYEDRALGDEALRAAPQTVLSRPLRVPTGFALVRVDQVEPARALPLAQVADSVIRDYTRARRGRDAGALVDSMRTLRPEAFRSVCTTWHAALVDTDSIRPKLPGEGDLEKWYRANLSEFAHLDAEGKGIVQPPYAEVRDAVRNRWLDKERWRLAGEVASRIRSAWSKGKRDRSAEERATVWYAISHVRDEAPAAPVPPSLIDSAWAAPVGYAGAFPGNRGFAVFSVVRRDSACATPPHLAVERLERVMAQEESLEVERGARAYFEAHRDRYHRAPTYFYTFAQIPPRRWEIVDIEPSKIERYYREHPDEFGQPAEVRVKHLLVHVPPRADTTAAWKKIQDVLAQAQAGANFDTLVRRYSDDPITRDKGGDLGWFRKGMTSPGFEEVAFRVASGEIGGPVRSPFGYHLVLGVEKKEEELSPLRVVRGVIGQKVAGLIADSLARSFADSLRRQARRAPDVIRLAKARGYTGDRASWRPGTREGAILDPRAQEDFVAMKGPGMLPGVYKTSPNYYVAYLDSISSRGPAEWEDARDSALADYRLERRREPILRAAERLQAELAAGVPWDSAAAPWGGGTQLVHRRGQPFVGARGGEQVDSALFGKGAARLAEGQAKIIQTDVGVAVIQLARRIEPGALPEGEAREALRRQVADRAFYDYFQKLKQRYPVRILRADLRIELPPPPAS